jgi:hypothetical protein
MGAAALPLAVLVMGAAAAVPAVPDLPLAVLVIRAAAALPLALPVPWGFAGMLVMRLLLMAGWVPYLWRTHLKSYWARTHLLLKPEGRQLDSKTLLPLWQRVQLLVLPVAYT